MCNCIPKVLHYCWFGNGEMSPLIIRCLESWSERLPDFQIKRWDESNVPLDVPFVKDMLEKKKWAFVSDYVRLHALYSEGGIYLDTDMEVVQDFSPLLNNSCFIGYESADRVTTGAMGAVKGSQYVKKCMDVITERHAKQQEYWIAPEVAAYVFDTVNDSVVAHPSHYFYPFNPYDVSARTDVLMFSDIKSDTYAIHHWNHAWKLGFFERLLRFVKKIFFKQCR